MLLGYVNFFAGFHSPLENSHLLERTKNRRHGSWTNISRNFCDDYKHASVTLNYVFMRSNIVSIGGYKTEIVIDSGKHRRFLPSYSTEKVLYFFIC